MRKRMLLKDTRALSHHIEMIISFTLFVLFVFFVVLFVQPHDVAYLTDSVVSGLQYNFINDTSTEVVQFYFHVDTSPGDDFVCFQILEDKFPDLLQNSKITHMYIDIDEGGGFFRPAFYLFNDDIFIKKEINSDNNKIYSSFRGVLSDDFEGFGELNPSSDCLDSGTPPTESYQSSDESQTKITFGSVRQTSVISKKSLEIFEDEYKNNYEVLKEELSIPHSYDFAISSTIFKVGQENIPGGGSEVFSYDFVEDVLFYKDTEFSPGGRILPVRFSIQLWR